VDPTEALNIRRPGDLRHGPRPTQSERSTPWRLRARSAHPALSPVEPVTVIVRHSLATRALPKRAPKTTGSSPSVSRPFRRVTAQSCQRRQWRDESGSARRAAESSASDTLVGHASQPAVCAAGHGADKRTGGAIRQPHRRGSGGAPSLPHSTARPDATASASNQLVIPHMTDVPAHRVPHDHSQPRPPIHRHGRYIERNSPCTPCAAPPPSSRP
jgi:hypothetical protein